MTVLKTFEEFESPGFQTFHFYCLFFIGTTISHLNLYLAKGKLSKAGKLVCWTCAKARFDI